MVLPVLSSLALIACSDDGGSSDDETSTQATQTGSESAEGSETNDGNMEMGDGDGDTGDGDGDTGDGDGDGDTGDGDGDGDTGDGDGDGDGDTGDGDGDGDGDCAPMDAEAIGDCEPVLGVAWDGESCDVLVGCECVGADCGALFDSNDACEAAYADCKQGDGCAGLGLEACIAAPMCQPISGAKLEMLGNVGWCAGEQIYLGCSSDEFCGDAISFACPDGEDVIFQTNDTCLPDVGYAACNAPDDQGFYEPCP
jgi:hypothetical protein